MQWLPGASVSPSQPVAWNSCGTPPTTTERSSGAEPTFVMTTSWGALVVPTCCIVGKCNELGTAEMIGLATPVPRTENVSDDVAPPAPHGPVIVRASASGPT